MLISKNWLQEHVDLAGLGNGEIDDILTFAGVEVEGITEQGVSSDLVVVAEVRQSEPHPNADRLSVCQVDAGEADLRQIVCGAKNYKVGDKVPCALPGASLPAGFTIGETKMRGVESRGMLCSATELGLGTDGSGLMILPADWQTGKPLHEFVENDTIFEIEVTPNRPDLLSHFGMAREVAALTGRELKRPDIPPVETAPAGDAVSVDGQETCPFYTAVKIAGVNVGPSPEWLQQKLEAIGLRPINSVVDITNFVLHELGQPLHAFDAAKISGGIKVRMAADGEQFAALDEETYELTSADCVISDQAGTALALGGVMGGLDSGVVESTTDVILESAWFVPANIRRTARRLILHSDSSYRFERGVDPQGVVPASALAAKLIVEIAGGALSSPTFAAGSPPVLTGTVRLDDDRLHQLTGKSISLDDANAALARLGLIDTGFGQWTVPSYRLDLQRHIDLAEEVVRVAGLDAIPARLQATAAAPNATDARYDLDLDLKKQLAALGFFEAQTIKLIADAQLRDALPLKPLQDGDLIRVSLPLSEDHGVLRPSLAPGLLATAARNARHGAAAVRFFEAGRCFRNAGGGKATDLENDSLGILLGGAAVPASWTGKSPAPADAFALKGIIEALLPRHAVQFSPLDSGPFLVAAQVQADGKPVGVFAQLAPSRARELDLDFPVYLAELDLAALRTLRGAPADVEDLPQFPGSSRDAALEAPAGLANAEIEQAVRKLNEPLLVSASCFDVFSDPTGEKLPVDRKSIAWSFHYRAADRTLKSEEVDAAHQKMLQHLEKSLPVTFR
ncbi:MAG: phenylalanine--tRNA ligase subunit beta [Akkermansiaceae bacterium]|nr:phenylalanine--tRNA ligase subunit beta [Akkermansiaceae bacterium]